MASHNFDGATYSLMDLIQSVKSDVNPIVLVPQKGIVQDYFLQHGIECIASDFKPDLCTNPKSFKQYIGYFLRYFKLHWGLHRSNIKCAQELANLLGDRKIDIVHINSTVLTVGYGIAKMLGCKLVWHLRGFIDLDFGWKPISGWHKYKKMISDADATICITNSVLAHFQPATSINGNSIFDAVRSKNDVSEIKAKEKYFLFCAGTLVPAKQCDLAIRAFAKTKLTQQGYRLKIVGRKCGKHGIQLEKLVDVAKLRDYVDFIPFTEDVRSQMEHATAFLMCSKYEGLGRVTVESMFYGCPVIGRNSGGTADIITDNVTGYLFNDENELAEKMQYVAMHDCSELIKTAQMFAVENFAIEDYGAKIMKIYNKVLHK